MIVTVLFPAVRVEEAVPAGVEALGPETFVPVPTAAVETVAFRGTLLAIGRTEVLFSLVLVSIDIVAVEAVLSDITAVVVAGAVVVLG